MSSILFRSEPIKHASEYRRFADFASIKPNETVLEVGSGNSALLGLIMEKRNRRNKRKVYFNDNSSGNLSTARDDIIRRFGQPPSQQSRFSYASVLIPKEREELKLAFDQPQGFDAVLARQFMNQFHRDSHPDVLEVLKDLVEPGGRLIANVEMQHTHSAANGCPFDSCTAAKLELVFEQRHLTGGRDLSYGFPALQRKRGNAGLLGEHHLTDDDCEEEPGRVERSLAGTGLEMKSHQFCLDRGLLRDGSGLMRPGLTNIGALNAWRRGKCDVLRGATLPSTDRMRRDIARSHAAFGCYPTRVTPLSDSQALLEIAVTMGITYELQRPA